MQKNEEEIDSDVFLLTVYGLSILFYEFWFT
jgi:hypothetical protein